MSLQILSEDGSIDLVLVPGFGAHEPASWPIVKSPWTNRAEEPNTCTRTSVFDHHLRIDDSFSWRGLLNCGEQLLDCVHDLRNDAQHRKKPILLVAHGMGGLVVKQALIVANQQHVKHRSFLDTLSGIVFLGTPHWHHVEFSKKCSRIVRAYQPSASQKLLSSLEDTSALELNAKLFEDVNLRIDIITVFELKPSEYGKPWNILKKRRLSILADDHITRIRAIHEKRIGLPLAHQDLVQLIDENANPHRELLSVFLQILDNAQENVNARLEDNRSSSSSPSDAIMSSDSIVSDQVEEAAMKALSRGVGRQSAEAEHGSSTVDWELIPLVGDLSIQRKEARLPCFMLGSHLRNDTFFGRESILKRIDEVCLPDTPKTSSSEKSELKVFALCGMGGIGKTEIAIEYAFSRRSEFDAVFWIRSDEKSKLEDDLSNMAVALDIEDKNEPNNHFANRSIARGWLASPRKLLDAMSDSVSQSEASWLLILDNADDPAVLDELKPMFGSGSVLITSRSPLSKKALATKVVDPVGHDLEPFSIEEATHFISMLAQVDADGARQIAERSSGIPLGLAHMAGIIRNNCLAYKEFLELYDDETEYSQLLGMPVDLPRQTARANLLSIWAVVNLEPKARSLLEYLAFLDPDCIQERIFTNFDGELPSKNDVPLKKSEWFIARGGLLRASLIQNEKGDIRIHRLLQDVVRAKISEERRTVVLKNLVSLLDAAFPKVPLNKRSTTRRWPECTAMLPHIVSVMKHYKQKFRRSSIQVDFELAQLLSEAGWFNTERSEAQKAKPILLFALEICEALDTEAIRDLTTDIHYALNAAGNETNDIEMCVKHAKAGLEIATRVFEESKMPSVRLGIAYNQRGVSLIITQEYDEAIEMLRQAIKTYESLPNFDLGMNSLPLANLGCAYWLRGDLEDAFQTFSRGLIERKQLTGVTDDTESFRCGRLLHGLGNVRWSQSEAIIANDQEKAQKLMEESERYHRRALEQYLKTIGKTHHRYADVAHRVAKHCLRHGDGNNALLFVDKALEAWNTAPDSYRAEIARTTFLRAKVLFQQGAHGNATKVFKSAVHLRSRIFNKPMKEGGDLTEEDFDSLVTFWSR